MISALAILLLLHAPANAYEDTAASEQNETPAEQAPQIDANLMVREAVRRINVGDYLGAQIKLSMALDQVLKTSSSTQEIENWLNGNFSGSDEISAQHHRDLVEIMYLYSGTLHEKGAIPKALAIYKSLGQRFPDSHRQLDIQYRTATAQSKIGDHSLAIQAIRAIGPRSALSRLDRQKIRLMRLTFKFRKEPTLRLVKKMDRRMRKIDLNHFPYDRARIRTELVGYLHQKMREFPLIGSQSEIVRNHAHRETLHFMAVTHLERAIALKQPPWVSQILILIGNNLMQTGDDLLKSPTPATLERAYEQAYRAELQTYVEATWIKALRYVNEGLHLATRLGLGAELQTKLASLKEAITSRIETPNSFNDRGEDIQSAE